MIFIGHIENLQNVKKNFKKIVKKIPEWILQTTALAVGADKYYHRIRFSH